jgi:hypothetical protein
MEFYFPESFSEQCAFFGSAFAALLGLVIMFCPAIGLKLYGLQTTADNRDGLVLLRSSLAGLYLGLGVAALLLAQPMVYLAVGITFAVAVFGNVLSILSDGGATWRNSLLLVVNSILAALPLVHVFGLV